MPEIRAWCILQMPDVGTLPLLDYSRLLAPWMIHRRSSTDEVLFF